MFSILGWILFGVIIGILARWAVPGNDDMNMWATILLGVCGSFVGGTLSFLLNFGEGTLIQSSSWFMSFVGSVICLMCYKYYLKNKV